MQHCNASLIIIQIYNIHYFELGSSLIFATFHINTFEILDNTVGQYFTSPTYNDGSFLEYLLQLMVHFGGVNV